MENRRVFCFVLVATTFQTAAAHATITSKLVAFDDIRRQFREAFDEQFGESRVPLRIADDQHVQQRLEVLVIFT